MGKAKLPAVVATAVAVPVAAVAGVVVFNAIAPAADDSRFDEDLSPVSVEVPRLSDEDAVVCLAMTAKAPESVADLPARPVEGEAHASEFVLAYGDPAVVATCGADAVEVEDTAVVYLLNGVCWFTEENGGTEWTTVDRQVPVGVTVPDDYPQPVDVLSGLSKTIAEAVPASQDAPSGCS
ncbi:DUF3515 family protein [Glycomyces arizonensis]|uniref:DUF3515 family protein n=1 Tax=Glycomyces arizonensis TaxID=256035 RepID=UPI000427C288|nr:DUF3515 family protein [Glycomyces arizonensis]